MHIIVGLGNPGEKYQLTRHNIGFLVIDHLADKFKIPFSSGKGDYFFGQGLVKDCKLLLVKPTTYMNNSGLILDQLQDAFNVSLEKLLIVYDDFHLPFGTVRFRAKGSDAGHNGIKSISYFLQTENFERLKMGIGSDFSDSIDYVLSNFTDEELKELPKINEYATDSIISWCKEGISVAMNKYNRKIINSSE